MQNSLNRRDAKSDVIPEAYKLWTRQHAFWGQSISISSSGEWLEFHSIVQFAKIIFGQKKVLNEFSSLILSKIAKIIRNHLQPRLQWRLLYHLAPGKVLFQAWKFWMYPFLGRPVCFLTENVFSPNTFSPWIQINILIFYKQDIKCKGWREHARVGTRT